MAVDTDQNRMACESNPVDTNDKGYHTAILLLVFCTNTGNRLPVDKKGTIKMIAVD